MIPDVGAISPVPAKFDIVDVRPCTDFENGDEFVFGPVKRSHPAVVLVPDAEVEEGIIKCVPSGQQLEQMTPVHENVVEGAVARKVRGKTKSG